MATIVLDTNSMPRGRFNSQTLGAYLNAAGGGKVVVPEVVVWEWAEHAHSALEDLSHDARALSNGPSSVALPAIPPPPSKSDLVKGIIQDLTSAGVQVWAPEPQHWRDALREQVLQDGMGEVRGGVKTGAADAIVCACVGSQLEDGRQPVILVSSDRRLRKRVRDIEEAVLVASGIEEVLQAVLTFVPPTEELALAIEENLPLRLNEAIAESANGGLSFATYGVRLEVGVSGDDSEVEPILDLYLSQVELLEVHDLRVARRGVENYGLASIRIFGDVQLVIEQPWTRPDGAVEMSSALVGPLRTAFTDVPVAISWDGDWNVTSWSVTGAAVVVLDTYDDDSDDDLKFRATHVARHPAAETQADEATELGS